MRYEREMKVGFQSCHKEDPMPWHCEGLDPHLSRISYMGWWSRMCFLWGAGSLVPIHLWVDNGWGGGPFKGIVSGHATSESWFFHGHFLESNLQKKWIDMKARGCERIIISGVIGQGVNIC